MEPLEIGRIRRFNRFFTELAGVLDRSILKSEFSLAEARILFEIGHHPGGHPRDFLARLGLDAGYFSRVAKRFKSKGMVAMKRSSEDARLVSLFLTEEGKKTLEMLEGRASSEVERCFGGLSDEARRDILSSMASILSYKKNVAPDDLLIRPYRPGELGIISYRHCVLYREEYGFDQTFENYLLDGMSRFLWDCGGKGQVWVVDYWGRVMGAIAIVETGETEAQLRWFYLEPSCRGIGMGRKLMETAMSYCERRGMEKVFLWTVKDLEAARYLYEKFGFSLVETNDHFLWGRHIVEEKWELQMAGVKGPC
jgi:DNA-binding MarR family transcriptional regulator/GNAT superfamily N-acetyltransferase